MEKLNKLDFGAKQAVETCIGLRPTENALIITDIETFEVADALKKACLRIVPEKNVIVEILEDYGKRPLKEIPEKIIKEIRWCDVCFAAFAKKRSRPVSEQIRIRKPISSICNEHRKRMATMYGITKEIMEQGMNVDYNKVKELSLKVYDAVKNAFNIEIKTDAGTDLKVNIKDAIWKNTYGDCSKFPQEGSNLPSGEVFCFPIDVNGTLVVDYEIGADFTKKYGLLKQAVFMEIKNRRIVSVKSENKELEKELIEHMNLDENANMIGELGVGTNIGIKEPIGIVLQDEKIPGCHIAFGMPCQGTYTEQNYYHSRVHCDMLMRNPTIVVDGKVLMEKGRFMI